MNVVKSWLICYCNNLVNIVSKGREINNIAVRTEANLSSILRDCNMILYNESLFFLSHVLEQKKPVLSITLKLNFNSVYALQKQDSSFDNGMVMH